MKDVISGSNINTKATVAAWLASGNRIFLATLYIIGEEDDPDAVFLTDWDSPLVYSRFSRIFNPATIKRSGISTRIGLAVSSLDIHWSPTYTAPTVSMKTANPYQRAHLGHYDNWPVQLFTAYMPTPGDCNTYGCSELWGGRLGKIIPVRGGIQISCKSFLDVINLNVPLQVVEISNPLAATTGYTAPQDLSDIPTFNVIVGSTNNVIIGHCTSSLGKIFDLNVLRNGFLIFKDGTNATLYRRWAPIQGNSVINVSGTDYNLIQLYQALPWPPTPGSDSFIVSGAAPINKAEVGYQGFPFVPAPEQSV